MKKFLAIVLAMLMVLAMTACAESETPAAAGSNDSAAQSVDTPAQEAAEPAAEEPAAEVKSYQLVGTYEEEGEGAARVTAAFKVDLNEDGTVVADRYRYLSGDYDDAFMTGTWKETERDGIECVQIDMACTAEDGTKANEQTVYAYEMGGEYSVEITFPIIVGMQYQRSLTVTGSAEKAYTDDESFAAAYKVEAAEEPAAGEQAAEEPAAEEPTAEEPAAAEETVNEYRMKVELGGSEYDAVLTLLDETNATFTAAMTFNCTYTKSGKVVTLTSAEELDGTKATLWEALPHELTVKDDGTMEAYVPVEGDVSVYAGEYDILTVNSDGDEIYFEEFIIEEDGTVHGSVDASGLTGFEGTVDAEGNISAEYLRLGGTMTGTVDADGNVSVHSEVRGRTSDGTGERY